MISLRYMPAYDWASKLGSLAGYVSIVYDKNAYIDNLYDKDAKKLYKNDVWLLMEGGTGEIHLNSGNEEHDYFVPGDSGSCLTQDGKLVGMITCIHPYRSKIGYFVRGGELKKLVEEYKNSQKE